MKLLNARQLGIILTNRLPGLKVSCTIKGDDVISLIIKDCDAHETYGITGIKLSHYRGKYGATALAHQIMEGIDAARAQLHTTRQLNINAPPGFAHTALQRAHKATTLTLVKSSRTDIKAGSLIG